MHFPSQVQQRVVNSCLLATRLSGIGARTAQPGGGAPSAAHPGLQHDAASLITPADEFVCLDIQLYGFVLCEAEILYFVMIDCWAVGESVIEGRGGF